MIGVEAIRAASEAAFTATARGALAVGAGIEVLVETAANGRSVLTATVRLADPSHKRHAVSVFSSAVLDDARECGAALADWVNAKAAAG